MYNPTADFYSVDCPKVVVVEKFYFIWSCSDRPHKSAFFLILLVCLFLLLLLLFFFVLFCFCSRFSWCINHDVFNCFVSV